MLANRIKQLQTSPTMAIDARAKALKEQGTPIINLSVGEPIFPTPRNIKDAAIKAINENFTYYTAPEGILPLREAIAAKFAKDNHIQYDPSQIIVGPGSKQLLYNTFQVVLNQDDEVIIATPTYMTFVEQVKVAGGKPLFIPLKPPFKLTANDVAKSITKKAKALMLNSPSNPTSAMIEKEELEKIAELAIKHNFWIVTDEIYEKIVYTTQHVSIASMSDEIKKKTITISGVSKSYSMTGWRLGYAGGPREIINEMKALQSQMIGSTSSISQMAALEALRGDQIVSTKIIEAFSKRRALTISLLKTIPELGITPAEGAFYAFVSLEKLLGGKYPTAVAWCEALLEKEKVALVPGEAFLAPGYFRLSFAASEEDVAEALKRIKRFIRVVQAQ